MTTIRVDMTEEQIGAVLDIIGEVVSWRLARGIITESSPLFLAERAMDSAKLAAECGHNDEHVNTDGAVECADCGKVWT